MEAISIRDLVEKYRRELVRLGYCRHSLKNYRVFWNQLISYFDSKQESTFYEKYALQFLDDRYGLSETMKTRQLTRNEIYVQQMVRKLVHFQLHGSTGRVNQVPLRSISTVEFSDILGQYTRYCVRQGYALSTRRNMRHQAIGFFMFLESRAIPHISAVTSQTVMEYLTSLRVYRYRTVGLSLTCLRSLLGFLFSSGFHHQDLCGTVPHQQSRAGGTLPSTWTHADVLNLIGTIDRGNPCGKRDYAIILMVTRLGVRAGDVRNLKLEHLNWEANRIEFIQSKTAQKICLPLLKDVGWAIIDYLEHGRPNSDSPFVFLRHTAPHEQLGEGNCFYHIINRCMSLAQITATFQQKVGLHSLRHTLASTLLEKHTPLSTIAGILGHTSVESTAIYLKTDERALCECALNVPGGVE
jgi:site-specific recombinase XerD